MDGNKKTDTCALINPGEDNEMELLGFKSETWRQVFCIFGYIFSLGFLRLIFYWKPEWDVYFHCVPCDLEKADIILLRSTDEFKNYCKKRIFWIHPFATGDKDISDPFMDGISVIGKALIKPENKVRCLRVQKIRYVWNNLEKKFQKIGILEDKYSCSDIHTHFGSGLKQDEQEIRKQVCGFNTIDVEVTPILKLLFKEVLNPYYVFQAFSLSLWFATGYTEYAAILVVITLLSIAATVYTLRKQSVKLHRMVASHNNTMVTALRQNGVVEETESQNLVPGDVMILTGKKFYLPCDSVLLTGSCVVNEGMLTGESVPVMKTSLPNVDSSLAWKEYSGEDYKRHVLFCGTEVIQAQRNNKDFVKAVVLRTGFNTAKGDLVRSILYPKPVNFKLHRDAIRFLIGLVLISLVGVIYVAIVNTKNNGSTTYTVLWCFLLVTVSIPAALPASLTVCILYSQTRLKKNNIFCLSAQRINMCGQLNIICFDKTGTLTEDGMELWGIVPSGGTLFQDVHYFTPGNNLPWNPLLGAMVSCHSLIVLDGTLQGDPLDMKMFKRTGWYLQDSNTETKEGEVSTPFIIIKPGPEAEKVPVEGMAILHQFPFSSSLQRMSVIAQVIGNDEQLVFMKGAPEMVIQFCKPETVPLSFVNELEYYTLQGFRVIALAYKMIELNGQTLLQNFDREDVESNLVFLGLLIMENKLKPETKPVLQELMAANIRTVMITGDNLQTACTVGKSSGMVLNGSSLIVIEAKAYSLHVSANISDLKSFCNLLDGVASLGLAGAVDTLFLSKPGIKGIEGRNSLVTSFCMFKYIAMYAMIELICVMLLFWKKQLLGTRHYLMQDVAITITVILTMSLTGPAPKLAPYRPSGQLISPPLLLSMILQFIFTLVVQTVAFTLVQKQPWYDDNDVFSGCLPLNQSTPNTPRSDDVLVTQTFNTTTLWFVSGMNLIIVEFVFCKGRPFRKPIYTNYVFTILLIAQLAAYLFVYFANIESVYTIMELLPAEWCIISQSSNPQK
ncbi:probable cation-transporting ATPase 13A4 [Pyxicephalus adspersus]|uniref:probable cation-transporting ATPase 13A4 n=1 Tax=Pyxicephalus adspersus TaxID=30357 RepID=UPI003B58F5BB